jgi:hypothetical protein
MKIIQKLVVHTKFDIHVFNNKISQQPENCENRYDPELQLVQAFLKKWWVESDCKAPNLPLFSCNCGHLFVTELVLWNLLHVYLAALRCTISSLLMLDLV